MYASCDSRHYGPVPYGLVQGKLFFRVTVCSFTPLFVFFFLLCIYDSDQTRVDS
jgi:hypothetical protein